MILLDTTSCIDYLNGDLQIKEKLNELQVNFCISTITIYEINIGLERTKRKISEKRYQDLNQKWIEFIKNFIIIPLDQTEAKMAAELFDLLESKGMKIDDNDCLIAGSMYIHKISSILTRNVRYFNRFEELKVITY